MSTLNLSNLIIKYKKTHWLFVAALHCSINFVIKRTNKTRLSLSVCVDGSIDVLIIKIYM